MNVIPMTPISTFKILSNVPLDNSYSDVIDFLNTEQQRLFFNSKNVFTFNNLTPIKMENAVRIPVVADKIYNCNYVMWQNSNFKDKWFYGFIKDINYVNVNMCEVIFELDVYQTWLFDYTLKECFVEREHVSDDTIGKHLVDENLEIGEYVYRNAHYSGLMGNSKIIAATSVNNEGVWTQGVMYAGIYSGLSLIAFDTVENANLYLTYLGNHNLQDAVTSLYMCPSNFVGDSTHTGVRTYGLTEQKNYTDINGYIPKNNKLFTYPYNFLYVTNLHGNSAEYRYEFFSDVACDFHATGHGMPGVQIVLEPVGYKNVGINYNESLTLDGFPQCAFTNDSYKAWLAQNSSSLAVSNMSSALAFAGGVGAIATGGISLGAGVAASGALLSIQNTLAQKKKAQAQPPQTHGNQSNITNFAMGVQDFCFMPASITKEYAEIIDNYFSMFGYQVNLVKIPNVKGRPSWNYVKTQKCSITSNIPFGDVVKLKEIFNKGITIWHGDYVGDYSRVNK